MGIHVLDFFASSANFWASSSRIKSASSGISVFHSFNPPKSFSPAFKEKSLEVTREVDEGLETIETNIP